MFFLRNLSSSAVFTGVAPWDFKPTEPIPEGVRKNKQARDAWINLKTTDHYVYTLFEGLNKNLRISRLKPDDSGNPVHSISGLVGDYDSAQSEEAVLKFASELPYPPNWIERTLSGNWRFVWLFEEPLLLPGGDFAKFFLKIFSEIAFDPAKGMIGFDKGAWEAPERYYTNSCDWRKLSDKPIPAEVTRGWLVMASNKYKFVDKEFGISIPTDVIAPALAQKYPRFSEWPGEFTLGAQGPSFWVDGSVSPKSAIVRETGIQTFAAHAAKGFYSWADLLGAAFVREYEAKEAGRAAEDIWYDGRMYWRKTPSGMYYPFEKADLMLHLKTSRSVAPKVDKSGVSDIERTLEHIQNNQRVEGAGPFIYRPTGLIFRDGKRFLNTSRVRPLEPAAEKAVMGPDGNFPWLSHLVNHLMSSELECLVNLAWTAWAYKHAYAKDPVSGQAMFIAGPAGVGKTLWSREILRRLFGGLAECTPFLTGEDAFSSDIVEQPLWSQDDGSIAIDARKHRLYSENIKRIAANPTFRCNEKFRKAVLVEWLGRLIATLNDDAESLRALPDLSMSNRDKVCLLRTASEPPCRFGSQAETRAILDVEMPFLARWLLDWEIPSHLLGDSRFGIISYHNPELLQRAQQMSQSAGFNEILADWKHGFFNEVDMKAEKWVGTAFQLHKSLMSDQSAQNALRGITVNDVTRHLQSLKGKGARLGYESRDGIGYWTIYRDTTLNQNSKH